MTDDVGQRPKLRDSGLMPALIGLAGVLIGAFVTTGVTYLGDRSHRIEEKRTATRLVANEIRKDVHDLVWIWQYGRVPKHLPRTGEWLGEGPVLARYANESRWSKVSLFYDDVEYVLPSLPAQGCVTTGTWKLGYTTAREGNDALQALGTATVQLGPPTPAPERARRTAASCRTSPGT